VIEGRADLLREEACSLGSPRISKRISHANLIESLSEKFDDAALNVRNLRKA